MMKITTGTPSGSRNRLGSRRGVLTAEWIIIISIIAFGGICCLAALRTSTHKEMIDISQAAINLDPSYGYSKIQASYKGKLLTTKTVGNHLTISESKIGTNGLYVETAGSEYGSENSSSKNQWIQTFNRPVAAE